MTVTIPLHRDGFGRSPALIVQTDDFTVTGWRTDLGVQIIMVETARGQVQMLPFLGQMLWDASFDGVRLSMSSAFPEPRPATNIVETYGCLAYHSGLLANGCPGPQDDHPLHGEMACAVMDSARLEIGDDETGPFLRLAGHVDHMRGFGPNYRAQPWITLRPDTMIEMGMAVTNRAALPMELMYMCHVNFAYVAGGRIHQAAPFTPDRTRVRQQVPAHVPASPEYLALLDRLARDPQTSAVLDDAAMWSPEQVFYIERPATDAQGNSLALLERPQGDGFAMSWRPDDFGHLARWILTGEDASVAAFALPSTCEPEGRIAERAKGHVLSLAPGTQRSFVTRFGYATATESADAIHQITQMSEKQDD